MAAFWELDINAESVAVPKYFFALGLEFGVELAKDDRRGRQDGEESGRIEVHV